MFVVCFGDGLGNQMFQYAFYCSLKKNYPHNDIKADIFNVYGGMIHNGFELKRIFNITMNECSKKEAFLLSDYWPRHSLKYKPLNLFAKIRRYLWGSKESHISQDDPTEYYKEVYCLSTLHSYIFVGNWVNEQYFKGVSEQIKASFVFPQIDSSDQLNYEYMQNILSSNAVSVHVRLGDYISSMMINLTVEYYEAARQIIEDKVENPQYFIFSDNPESLTKIKKVFPNGILVTGNKGNKSYIDMQLMSMCKHNIIANSTFSFWGAYLNQNDGKIVVAPSKAANHMKNGFTCSEWNVVDIYA